MNELSHLSPPAGAVRKKKRVGRGESSGWGKTSGAGHKGQKARRGNSKPARGFEGGQMPLHRRLPKRGFYSRNRVEYAIVNLAQLVELDASAIIDLAYLQENGIAKKGRSLLKILADGEVSLPMTIRAHKFSAAAAAKISAAGGTAELIDV